MNYTPQTLEYPPQVFQVANPSHPNFPEPQPSISIPENPSFWQVSVYFYYKIKYYLRRKLIIPKQMYRKYRLRETHVLQAHHYLISVQNENGDQVLVHQLVLGSQGLPHLIQSKNVQASIEESENQNVVNELKTGFQVYFDNHLLQIILKRGVAMVDHIRSLQLEQVVELINAMSIDFALALKQLAANHKHHEMNCLNNCTRFYSTLAGLSNDLILPFIQLPAKRIHYYDFHYAQVFAREQIKGKKKAESRGSSKLSEQVSFGRFIRWLIILLSKGSIVDITESLNANDEGNTQNLRLKAAQIKEKSISQLLIQCLTRQQDYNIHIFKKQCQLLIERHRKNINRPTQDYFKELHSRVEHRPLVSKQQKTRLSKSFINPLRPQHSLHSKQTALRQQNSSGKLKASKSQITLHTSSSQPLGSKGRKFKKSGINLFKQSKSVGKNTSMLYGDSTNSKFTNSSSGFNQSMNFGNLASSSSNWFNKSAVPSQDVAGKLRNFKKGNHHNFASAQQSPKTIEQYGNQMGKDEIKEHSRCHSREQVRTLDEKEMRLMAKLKDRVKLALAKPRVQHASIQFEQETCSQEIDEARIVEKQSQKPYKTQIQNVLQQAQRSRPQQVDVGQKMEQSKNNERQKQLERPNSKQGKRSIVSTFNLSVFDETKKLIPSSPKTSIKHLSKMVLATNDASLKRSVVGSKEQLKEEIQSPILSRKNSQKNIKINREIKPALIAKKNKQNIHNIYSDELEDINIDNIRDIKGVKDRKQEIKVEKNHEKSSIQTGSQQHLVLEKKKEQQWIKNSPEPPQIQRSRTKNLTIKKPILSDIQKTLQSKHYGMLLQFCNANKSLINYLPFSKNLAYMLNLLYYKTLLQIKRGDDINNYKGLIQMVQKKQKMTVLSDFQQQNYSTYTIDIQSLWKKSKKLNLLEKELSANISGFISGQEQIECSEQIVLFECLNRQGCLVLQTFIKDLFAYAQSNKVTLINKNYFQELLELGHMLTVTQILCLQRLHYYELLQEKKFNQLGSAFSFIFQNRQNQYIQKYRNSFISRELAYVSIQEQSSNLENWLQIYR